MPPSKPLNHSIGSLKVIPLKLIKNNFELSRGKIFAIEREKKLFKLSTMAASVWKVRKGLEKLIEIFYETLKGSLSFFTAHSVTPLERAKRRKFLKMIKFSFLSLVDGPDISITQNIKQHRIDIAECQH